MTLTPLRATLAKLSNPLQRQTQSDREMLPYANQAMQEERQKQSRFQPLQFVLDVLQRGQYLTANIADEVEESFRTGRPLGESTLETLKAAWQGLTGERKGDWETLLFGGDIGGTSEQAGERGGWLPEDFKKSAAEPLIKYGEEGSTGLAEGLFRPRKLIGLAANIALDPTTYFTFGATKGATQAAGKYADDVVRLTLATMGPDDFAKLGIESAGKSLDDILKMIGKAKNPQMERLVSEVYQNAYKSAIRNPVSKLMEDVTPRMEEGLLRGRQGVEDLIAQMLPESYKGVGTRKLGTFMGKEFGVSERYPAALRQWDLMGKHLGETKLGKGLGEAWWSVMNRGPVGFIRKALGFRNPYQQMLHLQQRGIEKGVHAASENEVLKLNQVFSGYDPKIVDKHRLMRIQGSDTGTTVESLLKDPLFVQQLEVAPEEAGKILELDKKINQIIGAQFETEKAATLANNLPWETTERISYFPQKVGKGEIAGGTVGRAGATGSGAGGFKKAKEIGVGDHVKNNADMFKFIMGDQLKAAYDELPAQLKATQTFDDFVQAWIVKHNLSDATLDLQEALAYRAIDHAQYMGRMKMISDFRQFGIPIDEAVKAAPGLEGVISTFGTGTNKLGLYKVTVPGFDDMIFDKDVADVLTKVGSIVSSDEATKQFASMFARGTAWWKGMVTLSPGFHARNGISNNLTGFLKYGPRWFTDKEKITDSIVGTIYALHPDDYLDIASDTLKAGKGFVLDRLNRQVGDTGFTIKELADELRRRGTISHHSQVAEEIGQKAGTTLNPFSTRFKGFDISRSAGDIIENQSKFLSFLHDYSDLAQKAGPVAGTTAEKLATHKRLIDYATQETDKWFIDYGDLTDFEKKVLKPVISFYTWIRKNIANQIAGIALYPGMYSVIPKVRGALKDDEDFDYALLPDYMENLGYYPVGKTAGGERIMRWANIPLEDLNKIPMLFQGNRPVPNLSLKEFANDVVANAHPLIKSAIELASGKDLFRQRDIRGLERAPTLFQYLNRSPKVVQFLDGILRKAGVTEGLKITPTSDGTELKINGTVARMLENNMPVLKAIDMMIQTPETIAELVNPNIEKWIEDVSGKKDYYEGLNEVFSLVSQMFGWKFKSIVEGEEQSRKEQELLSRAEELRAEARKQLPGYQKRRAQSLNARRKRAARIF